MNALLKDPLAKEGQASAIKCLLRRLGDLLRVFANLENGTSDEKFLSSLKNEIIVPAMELHMLMLCERDIYHVDYARLPSSTEDQPSAAALADLFNILEKSDCLEVMPSKRMPFKPEDLHSDELRRRLIKLCEVTPALLTQHISDKHGLSHEEILIKQQVLVSSDPKILLNDKKTTFFYELAFPTPNVVYQTVWE